jgi:hypothetical protein
MRNRSLMGGAIGVVVALVWLAGTASASHDDFTANIRSSVDSKIKSSGTSTVSVSQTVRSTIDGKTYVREYREENGRVLRDRSYTIDEIDEGEIEADVERRVEERLEPIRKIKEKLKPLERANNPDEFQDFEDSQLTQLSLIEEKADEAAEKTEQILDEAEAAIEADTNSAPDIIEESRQEIKSVWDRFAEWVRELFR